MKYFLLINSYYILFMSLQNINDITIDEWIQLPYYYGLLTPIEALNYFISDDEACNETFIIIDITVLNDEYLYSCRFRKITGRFTINVRGYTDNERHLVYQTRMTEDLHNAIIASSGRHHEKSLIFHNKN